MIIRTGRRRFLQTVAASAAATSAGCGSDEQQAGSGTDPSLGGGASDPETGPDAPGLNTGGPGGPSVSPQGSGSPVTPASEAADPSASQTPPGSTPQATDDTGAPSGTAGSPSQPTDGAGGAGGATGAADGDDSSAGTSSASGGDSNGGSAGSGEQQDAGDDNPAPQLTSPIGVALLGLGSYASNQLAPALQLTRHCRLVGIVTGTPSKVQTWQQAYGIEDKNVYNYDDMATMIDNPDIHVVYIVTPNHVHAQYAIAAARAGKHVWCEKPLAMNAVECQSIIDACREAGVKLSIGYRLQHEPNTQTIIEYASTRPFGAIQEVEALAGFRGFGPNQADVWRLKAAMGGGALYDMGVYSINAARYATGEEPIRVSNVRQYTERPDLFSEVDEYTDFQLDFPSGAVAHCRTSFGENMDRLAVSCELGNYHLAPMQSYNGVGGEASDGTQFNRPIENQQAKQMDDDALAIIEQRAVLVPGEEGLRDVRIVEAIRLAAMTGEAVDL